MPTVSAKMMVALATIAALTMARAVSTAAEPEPPSVEEARKALNADLDALHQKGEPVRPEHLARPSVPDAQNAVLDLRAAAKSIDRESKALRAYDDIEGPIPIPLAPQQADVIRAWVKESAPALKLIKSAMAKGKVDWQNKYSTPMIKVLLPNLADMRMLANLLHPAALLAHDEGDDIAALEHVRELLFLSRGAGDEPFLVSHLVEIGISAMAFQVCQEISPTLQLGKEPAMRDQLRRTIAELLDETDLRAHMRRAIQGERMVPADTALAVASGKMTAAELTAMLGLGGGARGPMPKPADLTSIALADSCIILVEMARVVDAASAADLPTALAKMKPWPPAERMDPKKHFFIAMMLPSLQKSFEHHYSVLAQRRLAATALAIRWYAMDHDDQFPKTLQDLVPAYLPAVPTDPMTAGGPLIYAPDKDVLYSVGIDGHDDGGDAGDNQTRGRDIVMPLK